MRAPFDAIDQQILTALATNARTPHTALGKRLGLSEGGIRKRVARLEKSGAIAAYTIRTGKKGALHALLVARIEQNRSGREIIQKAFKMPGILRAGEISGKGDLFLECVFVDSQAFNSFVDNFSALEGVSEVQSQVILEEYNAAP